MLLLVKSTQRKQSDFILRKFNDIKKRPLPESLWKKLKTETEMERVIVTEKKSCPDIVQSDRQKEPGNPGRAGPMAAPETDGNTDSETVRRLE